MSRSSKLQQLDEALKQPEFVGLRSQTDSFDPKAINNIVLKLFTEASVLDEAAVCEALNCEWDEISYETCLYWQVTDGVLLIEQDRVGYDENGRIQSDHVVSVIDNV